MSVRFEFTSSPERLVLPIRSFRIDGRGKVNRGASLLPGGRMSCWKGWQDAIEGAEKGVGVIFRAPLHFSDFHASASTVFSRWRDLSTPRVSLRMNHEIITLKASAKS